ncbi:MAG: segregation/condensation protein A [Ardenticatenaceae bacterium]|nr:segregation/condensation protein A [Ardenticatenaceae bacterium]MCB9443714.1 segregation/condensation protein A [Ardenticatenaceae bacterium]
MPGAYQISLPVFSGPLDLLLHLIERQEFDITTISLVKVTEQYLAQIEQLKENRIENLIDFLVVAARLVQIKSRALLPQTIVFAGDEEEEDPAEALIRQLKAYKRFKQAAVWFQAREEAGLRTYLRVAPPPKLDGELDMTGITLDTLITAVQEALARGETKTDSVAIARPRRVTIEGQISLLRKRLKQYGRSQFHDLLPAKAERVEVAITLLAVLELIKRRELTASQPELFGPIEVIATDLIGSENQISETNSFVG